MSSSRPTLTSFSELPRHLEATDEAEMLKNVVLHSVATALASSVLPVPGGPYNRMPCTASVNVRHSGIALQKPQTSVQVPVKV